MSNGEIIRLLSFFCETGALVAIGLVLTFAGI
jgi:hypothetical protein